MNLDVPVNATMTNQTTLQKYARIHHSDKGGETPNKYKSHETLMDPIKSINMI